MNEKVIDLWRQFDNVKVSCSIDDLGDRNFYIRYPSDWDTVIKNFKRLKEENFELDCYTNCIMDELFYSR